MHLILHGFASDFLVFAMVFSFLGVSGFGWCELVVRGLFCNKVCAPRTGIPFQKEERSLNPHVLDRTPTLEVGALPDRASVALHCSKSEKFKYVNSLLTYCPGQDKST